MTPGLIYDQYWLQAGRVDVGFLGAAQIDRFGNLNTTVIGDYRQPKTRLPGAGGAPEIAHHAKQIFVVLKQSPRSFVAKLDFCSSAGFLTGSGERARLGIPGAGPQVVITDLGFSSPLLNRRNSPWSPAMTVSRLKKFAPRQVGHWQLLTKSM